MTAAMIVLAVLLAVVLLALGLFLFACRRSPVPDFTKPAVIAQWGREDQTEEILAGITLMQDAEDVFLPSYDGLRLHGQLLQQPGAKGTILLFHGYRSSWIIDFPSSFRITILLDIIYSPWMSVRMGSRRAYISPSAFTSAGTRRRGHSTRPCTLARITRCFWAGFRWARRRFCWPPRWSFRRPCGA